MQGTKLLSVGVRVVRDDTGVTVSTGEIRCSARIGGRPWRAAAKRFSRTFATCVWHVPASAARKLATGSVTVGYRGMSVRSRFSIRLR